MSQKEYDDFNAWLERCPLNFIRLIDEKDGHIDYRFYSNTFQSEEELV